MGNEKLIHNTELQDEQLKDETKHSILLSMLWCR